MLHDHLRAPTSWRPPTKMRSLRETSWNWNPSNVWRHVKRRHGCHHWAVFIFFFLCSFWRSHVSVHFWGMAFLWPLLAWFWHRLFHFQCGLMISFVFFCWKHQSSIWTPHVGLKVVAGLWPICWWITAVSLTNALMVVRHARGFLFGGWGCSAIESTP